MLLLSSTPPAYWPAGARDERAVTAASGVCPRLFLASRFAPLSASSCTTLFKPERGGRVQRGVAVLVGRADVGAELDGALGGLERDPLVLAVGLGGDVGRALVPLAAVAGAKRPDAARRRQSPPSGSSCRRASRTVASAPAAASSAHHLALAVAGRQPRAAWRRPAPR